MMRLDNFIFVLLLGAIVASVVHLNIGRNIMFDDIESATDACANNKGLEGMESFVFQYNVFCNNGAVFSLTKKKWQQTLFEK